MDWLNILYLVFKFCLIPLLGYATARLIKFLQAKEKEVTAAVESDIADKYIIMLSETIQECVTATTQTYVDSLKSSGKFDTEAQKIAFNKTYEAVMAILSDEAKEYLTALYGDLQTYITNRIEAEVKLQK